MSLTPSKKLQGIELSEIRKMNALAKAGTINLGIGELPFNVPESVREAGVAAMNGAATRYTRNQGTPELCEAVAVAHGARIGKVVSAVQVVITNGAQGALWNTLYTYLDEGDEILIPEIGFSVYETICSMQRAKAKNYKLNNDFSIDFDYLESQITDNTKFIVFNNPGNPTGKQYDSETCKKLADLADKHESLYIISDEIYKDLYTDEQPDTPARYTDKVFLIDGISKKASATGLRIGWTISTAELAKPLIVSNQYIATCAAAPSQMAAVPAVKGEAEEFIAGVRASLNKNRALAYEILSKIPYVKVNKPEGAFYIFPDISHYGTSKDVAVAILEEVNVLTIPGIAFGSRGDRHIRISCAMDYEVLKQGLLKIAAFFENRV